MTRAGSNDGDSAHPQGDDIGAAFSGGLLAKLADEMSSEIHVWELVRRPDGSIATWRLAYANRAALTAWGRELDAVVGLTTDEIFPESNPTELFGSLIERIFATGEAHVWEESFPSTGQILQMTSIPVGDYFISTGVDVSELRRLERTVQQSEKLTAIGRLSSGVAHDFNNQLTGILGYAELLAKWVRDPELVDAARAIEAAALRSADLTRQLLAVAREGPADYTTIDVGGLVESTLILLRRSISRSIRIECHLSDPDTTVLGDRHLLESALLNIELNARDAMPGGGVLTLSGEPRTLDRDMTGSTHSLLPAGAYYVITVTDTGVGMPDEIVDHIFDPFFTTKDLGNGMGLATAHGTVERHGGTIDVISRPGAGSRFSVYLPISDAIVTPPSTEQSLQPPGAARIMVVDDEAPICRLYRALLEQHGHDVVTFTKPSESLEHYRRHHDEIDLLIFDLNMPDMDGVALFHALKAIDPYLKALAATGLAGEDRWEGLHQAGVRARLQKPFREAELIRAIAAAIDPAVSARDT